MKIFLLFLTLFFLACSPYNGLEPGKEYGFRLDANESSILQNPPLNQSRIYVYRKDSPQAFNIEYQRVFDIMIEYSNKSEFLAKSKPYNASYKDINLDSNTTVTLKARIANTVSKLSFTPKKDMIYCLQSEILQDDISSNSFIAFPAFILVEKADCIYMIEKKIGKINN